MTVSEFAQRVLFAASLEEKLGFVDLGKLDDERPGVALLGSVEPGRPLDLRMKWKGGESRMAKPNVAEIRNDEERGRLLHFFANHELLATELMALVLLKFPDAPGEFRRGVLRTLKEEQRHTKWYIQRMEECGVKFGDFPVSRYFWDMVADMETPMDYVTRLSLTFEQANLDYALQYSGIMDEVGDRRSAAVLKQIYKDEIRHVNYGLKWFRRWKKADEDDWTAFRRKLSFPLSPRRAKGSGSGINREGRLAAGFDEDFIRELDVFERSVGRTPNVFWFCPDAEDAMSSDLSGKAYHRGKSMERLVRDLEILMVFLARRDDVVLVREAPGRSHLETLRRAGFDLPEIVALSGEGRIPEDSLLLDRKMHDLRPWAWCPPAVKVLEPLMGNLPGGGREAGEFWNEKTRQLFAKTFAVELMEKIGDSVEPVICRSVEELDTALRRMGEGDSGQAVVKAAFGASGRGLTVVDSGWGLEAGTRRQMERVLAKQREVLLEPWLDRVLDFSVQYDMGEAGLRRKGIIRLENDRHGQFRACVHIQKFCQGMPAELARFLMGQALPVYDEGSPLTCLLEERLRQAGYRGAVGVDAFVWRDRVGNLQLRKVSEVNPRFTMGRLTLELGKRVAQGHSMKFAIVKKDGAAAEDRIELDKNGRLCGGRMCLNDRGRATDFLAVLEVWKKSGLDPDKDFLPVEIPADQPENDTDGDGFDRGDVQL